MDFEASNVGIIGMEMYIPKQYVSQTELEKHDGVTAGKYTIGLGQTNMAFCADNEDINSIALTVVKSLMTKYNVSPKKVGRLEVGTETLIDKSKAVKTVLMQLFTESGNSDIDGVDVTNACYGGTQALLNSIAWMESTAWDGRYAIVVAADIAVYGAGNARPTGGAGAIAMLIGPEAPIVLERGMRAFHMEHQYDFYKPNLSSEYPTVDGQLSIQCYLRALDKTYQSICDKHKRRTGETFSFDSFDYAAFHTPFNKLVIKSFGRLKYNEFMRNPDQECFQDVQQFRDLDPSETYTNRELEQAFVKVSADDFKQKVAPSTTVSKQMGNIYTGSVYGSLISVISNKAHDLVGKRVLVFSYGSGFASCMYTIKVRAPVTSIAEKANILARLESRTQVSPPDFEACLTQKEKIYGKPSFVPSASTNTLFPGTYYLTEVDKMYRRRYERVPDISADADGDMTMSDLLRA
eukprot:GFYU01000527.1.p2 GENE.GFYU01000527.1~~GFYU01000527.1.p2  ORF type:complete len:464 (+),score=177.94 GFYU01000527.1:117-1508(+)